MPATWLKKAAKTPASNEEAARAVVTEMLAASEFPCTKLEAAGFRHPQSTRQGLEEMVAWLRRQAG